MFSVYIAQLLNSPCLSSTAISRLNTGRIILDSRWSSTLLTGGTIMTVIRLVDGVRHCWTWHTVRLSMEFDIVDWRHHRVVSMEFDIVELWKRRRCVYVTCVDGVRLGRTSYSWSMEFDIVELWKTAVVEFGIAIRLCRAVLSVSESTAGRTRTNRRSRVLRPLSRWPGIHLRASPSIGRGTAHRGT